MQEKAISCWTTNNRFLFKAKSDKNNLASYSFSKSINERKQEVFMHFRVVTHADLFSRKRQSLIVIKQNL